MPPLAVPEGRFRRRLHRGEVPVARVARSGIPIFPTSRLIERELDRVVEGELVERQAAKDSQRGWRIDRPQDLFEQAGQLAATDDDLRFSGAAGPTPIPTPNWNLTGSLGEPAAVANLLLPTPHPQSEEPIGQLAIPALDAGHRTRNDSLKPWILRQDDADTTGEPVVLGAFPSKLAEQEVGQFDLADLALDLPIGEPRPAIVVEPPFLKELEVEILCQILEGDARGSQSSGQGPTGLGPTGMGEVGSRSGPDQRMASDNPVEPAPDRRHLACRQACLPLPGSSIGGRRTALVKSN